jgi:hypothetical protein
MEYETFEEAVAFIAAFNRRGVQQEGGSTPRWDIGASPSSKGSTARRRSKSAADGYNQRLVDQIFEAD